MLKLILDNTRAQTKAIKDDSLEELGKLIDKREKLMGQVDELDKRASIDGDSLDSSIKDLLSNIIKIDSKNKSLIEAGLDDSELELNNIKAELRKMREGRRQGENYGYEYGSYKEEGVFFDTKE